MKPTAGITTAAAMAAIFVMKSADYKRRYGCESCKYESRMMISKPCSICYEQSGTRWKKKPEPKPKPAYCECCGQEKGE